MTLDFVRTNQAFKTVKLDKKSIKLQVWHISTKENYKSIIAAKYYEEMNGIFLVYDLTYKESFEKITNWMTLIRTYARESVNLILIGNKCDVRGKRQVSYDEGKELADLLEIPFMEISAKTGENVREAFSIMVNETKHKFDISNWC